MAPIQDAPDGLELPTDPVGVTIARFLEDLFEGVEVTLSYGDPGHPREFDHFEPANPSVVLRQGPGDLETEIVVNLTQRSALVLGGPGAIAQLPPPVVEFAGAAVEVVESLGAEVGIDGKDVRPAWYRALQAELVVDLIARQVRRVPGSRADAFRGLVGTIIESLSGLAATTVEGERLTHGVVVQPRSAASAGPSRYPDDFEQKRVPLLLNGIDSVLLVDVAGSAMRQVRAKSSDRLLRKVDLAAFEQQIGPAGALVAATSHAVGGVGFYLHGDGSIWVYIDGILNMVRRRGRWRVMPQGTFISGIADLGCSSVAGGQIARVAFRLSLLGHGGILAVVDPAIVDVDGEGGLVGVVQDKDRLKPLDPEGDYRESALHTLIDPRSPDDDEVLRLASIDGATILDRTGALVAYGAVVESAGSPGEGARTAAARSLSRVADVVVKVSEDGPITVFYEGNELTTLLG